MIRGPILRVVASVTFPFMVLLTLYFLVSGHNNPGGGFIAGVLMSGAVAFQFLAHGPEGVPRFLKLPYERIVALGFVDCSCCGDGSPCVRDIPSSPASTQR